MSIKAESKIAVIYGVVMESSEYKERVMCRQGAKHCCDSVWQDYMNFCPVCGERLKFTNALPHQKGAGSLSLWGNVNSDEFVIVGFLVDHNIDSVNMNNIYSMQLIHNVDSSAYHRRINSELTEFCNQYDFVCNLHYHVIFTPDIESF